MKKTFYYLTLLCILAFASSCDSLFGDKDDDDSTKTKKTEIPKGWTKNDDLAILNENSWYLYRSGNDSIKLRTDLFSSSSMNGSIKYYQYYKKKHIKFSYLHDAYTIEKDGEKQIYGQGYKLPDYGARYELIDKNTVKIFNLPELDVPSTGFVFKAVSEKVYNDKSRLKGGWYHSEVVDSTVLVFEDNNIKEYLFVRNSSTITNSWTYGAYKATHTEAKIVDGEYLRGIYWLEFDEFKDDNCSYAVSGDKLTIYWNSPRKTTTYNRIKQ